MDLVDKEVAWVEESCASVILMGWRADGRGAGVPKGFLCQPGLVGARLQARPHPQPPSTQPGSRFAWSLFL